MPVIGPDETDLLRGALAASPPGVPSGSTCLDEGMVAALAEGSIDPETRATLLPHLAACVRCRTAVTSVARALADPVVAREARAVERDRPRPARRIWRMAVGIAAAAVLLFLIEPSGREVPRPHRGAPITVAPAPEAVWPVGPVAETRSLRWTAVPGADRYRVTLFNAEGAVLYEAEQAGTMAVLPDSVRPRPGETYWWKVVARLGFHRWAASSLIEFSVPPGPRR